MVGDQYPGYVGTYGRDQYPGYVGTYGRDQYPGYVSTYGRESISGVGINIRGTSVRMVGDQYPGYVGTHGIRGTRVYISGSRGYEYAWW